MSEIKVNDSAFLRISNLSLHIYIQPSPQVAAQKRASWLQKTVNKTTSIIAATTSIIVAAHCMVIVVLLSFFYFFKKY